MKLSIESSTGDQCCAVELQKLETIPNQSELSRVPALRNFIPGFSSIKLKTGEPQVEQNPLLMCDPAEPVTVKYLRSPWRLIFSSGRMMIVAFPEPVDF